MKIYIFDAWKKFMPPVAEYWKSRGHEVQSGIYWGKELTDWADIAYFYPVQDNLVKASRGPKPEGLRVVAEAVDIDIYANNLGGVNWDNKYVDALVFMAHHTKALALKKWKPPDYLPMHIVPGGVDLDKWTYRENPSRNYNVAWIGRLWIAKGVFHALQIFYQLIKTNPEHPWKLFIRGEKYHPDWYESHVKAYLEANPELVERVEIIPGRIDDLNGWLEDKSFYLCTSLKEAFSYTTAECAAKGIKPIVGMTNGIDQIWPSSWIFQTHDEAVRMFLDSYEPETYRAYVADQYPLSRRVEMLDEICGLT